MKEKLAAQEKDVTIKNEEANQLIKVVGAETEKVSSEKVLANEEEKKVKLIKSDVAKKQKDCEQDLLKAEPALMAAKEALDTLNKVSALINQSTKQSTNQTINLSITVVSARTCLL